MNAAHQLCPLPSRGLPRARSRGAVLIVALLLCAIIGISLASYIKLGYTNMTLSNRTLYNNAAMNLAENGIEEAMYAINKWVEGASGYSDTSWSSWYGPWGPDVWPYWGLEDFDPKEKMAIRTLPTISSVYTNLDPGVKAYVTVNVRIDTTPKDTVPGRPYPPVIIARASVSLPRTGANQASPLIEKWIQVNLEKSSFFASGLVAKRRVRFNGNGATVNSWHSKRNDDGTLRGTPVAYDPAYRHANGSVATVSVEVDDLSIGNGKIYGYASTGGALPSLGSQGLVGDYSTSNGTMDMTRVSTDFSASFDNVITPTLTGNIGSISVATTGPTLGTAGVTQTITATDIALNGNADVVTIDGDVTLILTSTSTAIKVTGASASIILAPGATLTIYTAGDIAIAGSGIANAGIPENLQIYGTKTTLSQNVAIRGNGELSAAVYAPFAELALDGGGVSGQVSGSFVANNITLNGGSEFHYDEALADLTGDNPYRVSKWQEITTKASRNTVYNDWGYWYNWAYYYIN